MNLTDWLKEDHSLGDQLQVMESLCRAVTEAHRRSPPKALAIDPARIMIASGDCRIPDGVSASAYRAPEALPGVPATLQADIHSVGVVFYQMLAGRLPSATGVSHIPGADPVPAALRDVRPDVPRDLVDGIMACLEADPDWRPKDLDYLRGVIDTIAAEHPALVGSAPTIAAADDPARAKKAKTQKAPKAPKTARPPSPGSPLILGILTLALIGLAGAGWYSMRALERPDAPLEEPAPLVLPSVALPPSPSARPSPSIASRPSPLSSAVPSAAPPSPSVAPAVTATPAPRPSPTPTAAPSVAPSPSPSPVVTVTPEPAGPAVITALSPPRVKRPGNAIVDVRGTGLRGDHQARLLRGRDPAAGIEILRQRFVNPTLLQVILRLDGAAAPGTYMLLLVDAQGRATNVRPLEVTK